MTVQKVIDELSKIEDKRMPVFIDCVHCGHPLVIRSLGQIVLVETRADETQTPQQ